MVRQVNDTMIVMKKLLDVPASVVTAGTVCIAVGVFVATALASLAFAQSSTTYEDCEKHADGTCRSNGAMTESDGGRDGSSAREAEPSMQQRQKCNAAYDVCSAKCKGEPRSKKNDLPTFQQIYPAENACKGQCRATYGDSYDAAFQSCTKKDIDCRYKVIDKRDAKGNRTCTGNVAFGNLSCEEELQSKCRIPYEACKRSAEADIAACHGQCAATARSLEGARNASAGQMCEYGGLIGPCTDEGESSCYAQCDEERNACLTPAQPAAAPPIPSEPEMCKKPIAAPETVNSMSEPPPATRVQAPTEVPHGPLCSASEAAAAQINATEADVALVATVSELDRLDDRFQKQGLRVRRLESDISLTKQEIAQVVSLIQTRKDSGLSVAENLREQKKIEAALAMLEEGLPRAKAERDQLATRVAQAQQEKEAAIAAHADALSKASRCRLESQQRSLEEEAQARRQSSEDSARRAAAEMLAQKAAAEKEAQKQELREKVSDFHKKQVAGLVPSSIQAPLCAGDYVDQCKTGEVRAEEPYACSYAEVADRLPTIEANPAVAIPDADLRGFRNGFAVVGAISKVLDLKSAGKALFGAVEEATKYLANKAVGKLKPVAETRYGTYTPDSIGGAAEKAQTLIGDIQDFTKKTRMIGRIVIPVRVRMWEGTESFSCKAGGASWQAEWEKVEPEYELTSDTVENVEFVCPLLSFPNDAEPPLDLDLSSTGDGSPCSFPNAVSELPAVLARLSWEALDEGLNLARAPASDPRCPVEPPR